MPYFQVYYQEGNSPGPFDIYLSGSSGLELYDSGVTQAELDGGYFITLPSGFTSSSIVVFDMAYGCATQDNVPFPTPSISITPSISVTPSKTPSVTVTPSVSVTPSVTPTATPSVTPPPSNTPSITPSVTPSKTPLISLSPTPSISISRTPSASPSQPANLLYIGTPAGVYNAGYLACSAYNTIASTAYYILYNGSLAPGNYIYTDPACTIPVIGNNRWIALSYLGIGPVIGVIQVDNSGQILASGIC